MNLIISCNCHRKGFEEKEHVIRKCEKGKKKNYIDKTKGINQRWQG
jgi:hypothetical protein